MIYLKDLKTGVTVEDQNGGWRKPLAILIPRGKNESALYLDADEADSLLRGLLRWKLETMGDTTDAEVLQGALYMLERSR